MDMGLTEQRARITGSSTGLERVVAEMPAAEGSSVVVHGRNRSRTERVAQAIRGTEGADLLVDAGVVRTVS